LLWRVFSECFLPALKRDQNGPEEVCVGWCDEEVSLATVAAAQGRRSTHVACKETMWAHHTSARNKSTIIDYWSEAEREKKMRERTKGGEMI
jgi:hypothetical protein